MDKDLSLLFKSKTDEKFLNFKVRKTIGTEIEKWARKANFVMMNFPEEKSDCVKIVNHIL